MGVSEPMMSKQQSMPDLLLGMLLKLAARCMRGVSLLISPTTANLSEEVLQLIGSVKMPLIMACQSHPGKGIMSPGM
jgi:hypothetical protein